MIPVIINNFNWLSTTKKLVEDLIRLGYDDIHILDNGSTYPPLLDWYKDIQDVVKVKYLNRNVGPRALWDSGYIQKFQHLPWIAYTDSDIELNPNTPKGFIEKLVDVTNTPLYKDKIFKVGLALRRMDIPDTNMGNKVIAWEDKYWQDCNAVLTFMKENAQEWFSPIYEADIDTTFAVIKPQLPFDYKALRVAGDFTARHIPWYTDFNNLTEEEKYVLDHSDSTVSNYKGNYLRYLKEKEKQSD